MKANKMVVAALSLALSLSMVACNKKENTPANGAKTTTEQNTADTTNNANNDYVEKYSRFYGDTLGNLGNYRMYETPEATTEYYKTNQYPGNEKYVEELKAAYKDSRDKIQTFVDDLKKDIEGMEARHEQHKELRHEKHEEKKFARELKHQMKHEEHEKVKQGRKVAHEEKKEERHERHEEKKFEKELKHQMKHEE